MISDSIASNTVIIELMILAAVVYAAAAFFRHRRLAYESARAGFWLILFGLGLIGLFFAVKLSTDVLALAGITTVSKSFDGILHAEITWLVRLFGIGAICFGVTSILRDFTALHHGLVARENALTLELAERECIHNTLTEQGNLLNSIIDNLPVALLIQDRDLKAERANPTFLNWYGLDAESLATIDLKQTSSFHQENDHQAMVNHGLDVFQTGEHKTRQVQRKFKNGDLHTISITKFPVYDIAGQITKVGSVSVDLTNLIQAESALEESQQRYRNVFEFAPYPIYIHDGRIIFAANPEAAVTYGFESPEAMIGFPIIDLVHPDDRAAFEARVAKLQGGGELPFIEDRRVRRDGSTIQVVQSGTPIPWRGEMAILAINRDVTRERENETRLRQAQKMEAIGQLTAGIAHDFNNMLGVIIGNCEILEDQLGQHDPQLAAISKSAENGARLTQRLLAFSRKQALQPVAVDAHALVQDIKALLSRALSADFEIDIQAERDLWRCNADVDQLENALVNLINNARDAMPNGGKLVIGLANAELKSDFITENLDVRQGQYVMITIMDHGVGIAPENLPHVFEPFFTTKDIGVGSGLGLSMIYGFVKQSGGHISIKSELNHGTTVRLYFPRVEAPLVDETPRETPHLPVGNGETILIVEDDGAVRKLVAAMLTSLGYAIAEASNSDEALERLTTPDVDLVLTDIMLSTGLKGHELAQEIRRRGILIRILYMSGYSENVLADDHSLTEGRQLLRKPFRKSELARAVRQTLEGTA